MQYHIALIHNCIMKKETIDQIFATLAAANPTPKTELVFSNDYTLLVAVVLSAQATDVGVNKATKDLFLIADTPQKMLDLGEARLKSYVKTIGLYNTKAANIIKLSQQLLDEYDGDIPEDLVLLQTLPGVGRKTANVWLNCARGHHTIAVDTHVFRVSNRLGITRAKNVVESEKQLEKRVPDQWKEHAHHWLILQGRYVCKARKPECARCTLIEWCQFSDKTA